MTDNMRSRVLGMILGSVSRGQFPQREPVAFLYGHVAKEGETPTHTINGVGYVGAVLPKLHVVEGFENVLIFTEADGSYTVRYYTADARYLDLREATGHINFGSTLSDKSPYLLANCQSGDTVWSELTEYEYGARAINVATDRYTLLWANFNVEYDGTTYMPASDPVPVYE